MRRRSTLALATAAVLTAGLSQVPTAIGAGDPQPDHRGVAASEKYVGSSLGNGLGRLLAQEGPGARSRKSGSGLRTDQESLAIRDGAGRVLVDLTPQAGVDRAAFRRQAAGLGLVVTATDPELGTLEGYTPLSAVPELAGLPGTGTIAQAVRPHTNAGKALSQGVPFQRVDRVLARGVQGQGMTIGVLSDSFDDAEFDVFGNPLTVHAADDVASGDLPGPGNPQNPQPVVVIQEGSSPLFDTDEGRGMLQIVHDVAPKAKLCFATAFSGVLGFADNIRALADKSGPCGADVIVDDVTSGEETPFVDNAISDAIGDVSAQGVSYFSSAGNQGDHQGWASRLHLVRQAQGARGTNLDFSAVDPALYAGGLADMDPGRGVDIAQDVRIDPDAGAQLLFSWNDPADTNGAQLGDPLFSATGAVTEAEPTPSFTFTPTADQLGQEVVVTTDAIPSGTTDLILDLVKPDGTEVGPVDTGSSPERLSTTLDQPGTYTITVSGFAGDTGDFTVDVRPVVAPSKVTTDFNLLLFGPDGTYYGAFGDDNTLTGRPQEVLPIGGVSDLQLVVARRTTGYTPVSQLSYQIWGEGYVAEHYSPSMPSIVGHHLAARGMAVAAYDPFPSYLPEPYTSTGGRLPVYFDSAGNRYARPQVRLQPAVASTDRGNTTFFVADDARDPDDLPNFGGTSAAAPHAAAIAALVLQKAGGPASLTPEQVRRRLERSAFAHDLDPWRTQGRSRGVTVRAVGDQGDERDLVPGSLADPNFFRVVNTGRSPLRSITFFGETASPTALGPGSRSAGIVFDNRPLAAPGSYREGGFPFQVGGVFGGLRTSSVSAQLSEQTAPGLYRHLTVRFAHGLKKRQAVSFGIDRDLALWAPTVPAIEGNGADELGGATFLPSGRTEPRGLRFVAVRADGSTVRGALVNRLGRGWSPVDGYGVVDAERAVLGR